MVWSLEKKAAYQREWSKANRDKVRKYRKKRRQTLNGKCKMIWSNARARARKTGKEFNIKLEFLLERVEKGKCELTGAKFCLDDLEGSRCHPYAPSIDRIDSSKGYTKSNCQVVLWGINQAKSEMSMTEFKKFINLVWEGMNETTH